MWFLEPNSSLFLSMMLSSNKVFNSSFLLASGWQEEMQRPWLPAALGEPHCPTFTLRWLPVKTWLLQAKNSISFGSHNATKETASFHSRGSLWAWPTHVPASTGKARLRVVWGTLGWWGAFMVMIQLSQMWLKEKCDDQFWSIFQFCQLNNLMFNKYVFNNKYLII